MNWTGGRLQRSKANANTIVKSQKHHFAKARLRPQNELSPRSPVASSVTHGQHDHDTEMQDDISVGDNHRRHKRSHHRDAFPDEHTNGLHSPRWRHHYHDSTGEPQRKRRRSQGSPDRRGDKGLSIATEGTRYVSNTTRETALGLTGVLNDKLESPGAEANTLQNVKRNLLKRPDWTGLCATRPVKMVFATIGEVENIGKRRQIPEPGVRSNAGARRDSNFYSAISRHPLVDQNGSNTSILHTEEASVRIGSNIHRTQTTPQSQSASAESMLLDKFDAGASLLDHTQKAKEALRPTDSQHSLSPKIPTEIPRQGEKRPAFPHSGQVHPFQDSQFPRLQAHASSSKERSEVDSRRILPSLDQLRDIKNFDELKASSAVRPSQGLTFPPQFSHRSTMQKEVLGNGQSGDQSNSIVNGWRLLPSCDDSNQSADQDSVVEQMQSHPMIFGQSQATRADTTKSPRVFLLEHPSNSMSPADVSVPGRDFPTNYREQICSSLGLDTSAGRTTANSTAAAGPGNLVEVYLPQPIFTLEQQVSDEMTAKARIDACQSSTFNRPEDTHSIASASTTRSYQSWTKSPARPSHYEAFLHHIEPLSNGPLDVVVSKTSARYATRPEFGNLSAVSNEERSPNLLNRTTQTPRDVSEATLRPIVMTSLFQPTPLRGVPRVRQLQDSNNCLNYTPSRLLWGSAATEQKVNHDEALMESLVPSLGELRNAFEFEPRIRLRSVNVRIATREEAREAGEVTRSNKLACRPPSTRVVQNASPTASIRTSANTVLYSARELPSSQPAIGIEPSETDFLTPMSPMEGKLDERLANISVYNNAARSIRSFVPVASPNIGSLRSLQSDAGVACTYT